MLNKFISDNRKKILFYANGAHHLSLYSSLFCSNPDFQFIIYSPRILIEDYINSPVSELENVFLCTDFADILPKLKYFGLCLTTDTQAARAHKPGLTVSYYCSRLGIKVIELQHGMFQLGMHYAALPELGKIPSDAFSVSGYRDAELCFYPSGNNNSYVMGYPPFDGSLGASGGKYCLVMSNLHWQTYGREERARFYASVWQLAYKHPRQLFLWRMHPGEKTSLALSGFPSEPPPNLKLLADDPIWKKVSAAEIIRKAAVVISTVSTVLLDCEICRRPLLIYETEAVSCLLKKIRRKKTFRTFPELDKLFSDVRRYNSCRLDSGLLLPYDNLVFRRCVENFYGLSPLPDMKILEVIMAGA